MLGLHDNETESGLFVFWRDQQIDMFENTPSWLVQNESTQSLIIINPARLLPNAVTGRRGHPTDNDVANFTFRMTGHNVNYFS
jgi:hypothetical protein